MSLDTTLSYRNPQTPLLNLIILPLNLITVIYLAELFKDVLKVVKATPSATDTPKATKP